jgi:alcohol dehydrogenase
LALLAAGVIVGALPAVTQAPSDRAARAAMLEAASAAGIAIDHCGTGVGHAVGHALASLVTIPHGLAVMLGSRAALEWSIEGAPESFESLAHALSPGMTVRGLPGRIDAFLEEVGFDSLLRSRERPSVAALADEMSAPDHRPMCLNNARPVRADDRLEVARMTLERWP